MNSFPIAIAHLTFWLIGLGVIGIILNHISFRYRKLMALNAMWRLISENSSEIIMLVKPNGIIRYINRTIDGWPNEEVIGRKIYDFLGAEAAQSLKECVETVAKTGKPGRIFNEYKSQVGPTLNYESKISPVVDDGKIEQLIISASDITERLLNEKALRKNEEKFRTVANFTADWEYWIDPEWHFLHVSPSCEQITGYTPTDFYENSRLLEKIIEPENLKDFLDHHQKKPADLKEQCIFEFQITTRSGEKKWIEHTCQPVFDSNDNWLGRRASNRDITSRKQAEEDLLAERAKLEQMLRHEILLSEVAARLNTVEPFNQTKDSLFEMIGNSFGLDWICFRKLDENRLSGVKLIDWKSDKYPVSGDDCPQIIHRAEVPIMFDRILRGENAICFKTLELGRDEQMFFSKYHLESIAAFPLIMQDKVWGFIIYGMSRPHDWLEIEVELFGAVSNMLTSAWERELHSKELLEAERKRAEAIQLAEKSSRLAALGTLAAGIAHEINQPLTALKIEVDGNRHLLKRKKEKYIGNHLETLDFISEQASRISEIIVHMRALARQEKQVDSTALDLNNTVSRALSLIDEQLYTHGIKLEISLDNSIPDLTSNGTIIEQVVINLVVNAMHELKKQIDHAGMIKVSTRKSHGTAIIEVLDNGSGIPKQDLEHIFDPFFTTKPVGEGMGLGLSITENLARGLGGHIRVSNSAGGGAVFTVTIPLN